MLTARRFYLGGSLLGLFLFGCDGEELVEPRVEAAPAASGVNVNAPSNVSAVASSESRVDLSWQDKSTNETGFEVHRSTTGVTGAFALQGSTVAGAVGYSDVGLKPSTQYCYKLRAFRTAGKQATYSVFSNAACATTSAPLPPPPPPGPKNPPSGLNAVAIGSSIALTWMDNSSDEDGFRVEQSPSGSEPWTLLHTISGPNATISSDGALPEQQRCYRVLAFNKEGNSNPSNVECATTLFPPTSLSARQVDDRTIDLSWTNRSTLGDGVEVYRAPTRNDAFALIGTVMGTATAYRDVGLTPNTTYWYMVRTKRQDDVSDSYTIGSASTATVRPNAPSGVIAHPNSSISIYLWWQDNALNESGYRLEQSDDSGSTWRTIETINFPDQGFWSNEGPVIEQTVCYRIFAFNDSGESDPSPSACTALPAAATELSATMIDQTTVELTWHDNSTVEDGYDILRSPEANGLDVIEHVGANVSTFRDVTVPAQGFTYYAVRPTRGAGSGDWSNTVGVGEFSLTTSTARTWRGPAIPNLSR